ncbi:MAG: DUF4388 domain-containing protein [Deltaproteobacteria bacterium]|nr:DUF4388 domain-containing protein [Deltaproteobacteria bacterium]
MATISGDIGFMPVGDLVIWIANRALNCTMTVRRRGAEAKLVVRDGQLWQAASSDPREYLGQHLINFGYISEDQLQRAFDTQQETHVPLGRVLVMVEAVTQEQLDRVLVFKTRESLLEAMGWGEGTFKATDDVPGTRELDVIQPVDLFEAHSEALARMQMWQEIRRVFPSDATRVEVTIDPARLAGFDKKLVTLMLAGRSIGEASLELRSMDFQTYARLYDLYNRGAVRPRLAGEAPPPRAPPSAPPPQAPAATPFRADMPRTATPRSTLPTPPPGLPPPPPVRAEVPREAPGVQVPAEAQDPAAALRLALAGRNWSEALLMSQRILERDPLDAEGIAGYRIAEAQLKKSVPEDEAIDMRRVPKLGMRREQIALAHLTSKERYVLSRVDGRRSLQQIAAVSPIQKAELVRIVNAFVSRGVLKLDL